jgi:hypothetical protein
LKSKFNWVLGDSVIYEDREDYWGRDGWIVDNIKCSADIGTSTQTSATNTGSTNSVIGSQSNTASSAPSWKETTS